MAEGKDKKRPPRKLTWKEKEFAKSYVKNKGNATEAALEVYNVKDRKSANKVGYTIANKPKIQKEIAQIMDEAGLSREKVIELVKRATVAGIGEQPRNSDALRGLEMLTKLHDLYPATRKEVRNVNVSVELSGKEDKDLLREMALLNEQAQNYVEGETVE